MNPFGNNNKIHKYVYIGILILVIYCVFLQYTSYNVDNPELDEKDEKIIEFVANLSSTSFSGTVLVAKGNTVLATNAVGLADRGNGVPNTLETQFNLGSMNKMFTAVAIMQLVEQGKIDLNNTVGDYLIDYPNREVAEKVTIYHLLTHKSGLGDFFYRIYLQNSWNNHSDVIDYLPLFVDDPLLFEPGTQSRYSNAGYIVLGLIIEEVSGQSYFDYIRENIIKQCGMTSSTYLDSERSEAKVAVGYSFEGTSNIGQTLLNGCPAGGGYSTVYDLYNFSRALLAGELLSPEYLEIMFIPRSTFPELGTNESYGYGLMSRGLGEDRMIGHGGGSPGVSSACFFFPDQGYFIIVLSNIDLAAKQQIDQMYEMIIKEQTY